MIRRRALLAAGVCFTFVATPPAVLAGPVPPGDDFNDGVLNPSLWGPVQMENITWPMLVETNGHLEFQGTDFAGNTWLGSQGSYTQDWEVRVDVNLAELELTQDYAGVSIVLAVGHDDDDVTLGDRMDVWLSLDRDSSTEYYRTFNAWTGTNGWDTGYTWADTSTTQATLRIAYTATARTLTAWIDPDGSANGYSWTGLLSERVDNLGADWGMNTDSRFIIGLGASAFWHTVNPSDGVFFDNFAASGGFLPPVLPPTTVPGLYLTNAVLLPNGFAQFELVTPSTNAFTLQYSFDLRTWKYWTTLWGADHHSVQTPGPISEVGNTVFVRAAPFGQAMHQFTFDFRCSWNGALENGSPALSWPLALDNWQAKLEVGNTTNLPSANEVTFSGPAGRGLVDLPVEFWPDDDYSGTYESDIIDLPPAPPGGNWVVEYGTANMNVNHPDPQVAGRFVVVVPNFVVSNGLLTSVSWTYRHPSTGANLGPRPGFVRRVEFTLYGPDFAQCSENDYDIFYRQVTDPGITNFIVSPPIPWSNPLWQIGYVDDLNNTYTLNYSFGNLYQVFGANSLTGVDCDPMLDGWTLLGSATNTATFIGSYDYYLIRAPKHNVAKIDAVRGSNSSYYGTSYTGNTADAQNIDGPPDGP